MALEKKDPELTTWNSELECWEGVDDDGFFTYEWCDENGYLHREGAPARISYEEDMYRDAYLSYEGWWIHGKLHREGAPAEIWYRQDGTPVYVRWWIHGEESTPLYSRETLVKLVRTFGENRMGFPLYKRFLQRPGFRTNGKYWGFLAQIIDLDSLLE